METVMQLYNDKGEHIIHLVLPTVPTIGDQIVCGDRLWVVKGRTFVVSPSHPHDGLMIQIMVEDQ